MSGCGQVVKLVCLELEECEDLVNGVNCQDGMCIFNNGSCKCNALDSLGWTEKDVQVQHNFIRPHLQCAKLKPNSR